MNDGKTQAQDQLDRLLADYFRPETAPVSLGRRIAAAARESETDLTRLEGKLAIEATPRGISLVRTGRVGKPATAAARRLTEQAREEIHEYLRGQRAFFRVPVDLAAVPDFQRKVLEAARLIPFGEARPYAWVAARIGNPRAVRAVGTALGRRAALVEQPPAARRLSRSASGVRAGAARGAGAAGPALRGRALLRGAGAHPGYHDQYREEPARAGQGPAAR